MRHRHAQANGRAVAHVNAPALVRARLANRSQAHITRRILTEAVHDNWAVKRSIHDELRAVHGVLVVVKGDARVVQRYLCNKLGAQLVNVARHKHGRALPPPH